jgi:hypothetical protein
MFRSQETQQAHLLAKTVSLLGESSTAWPVEDAPLAIEIFGLRLFLKDFLQVGSEGVARLEVGLMKRLQARGWAHGCPGFGPGTVEEFRDILVVFTGDSASLAARTTLKNLGSFLPVKVSAACVQE